MQAVTVDGVSLHVRVEGPEGGPALVFANSLGTDLRVWEPLLPHLPTGLRLVRYDKRGHGLSDCPEGGWSIETLADDLAAILDTLGVRAAAVCGLSVGGMIAQALAASRPDLVRALILTCTAARIGPAGMWGQRIAAVEAEGIAPLADPVLERWFTAPFRAADPTLPLWRNMLVRTPAAGYAATCAAIRGADLTASTRALASPASSSPGPRTAPRRPASCAARPISSPAAASRKSRKPGACRLPSSPPRSAA